MASSSQVRAGAAYVELSLQDNRLTRGLEAASKKLKAFGAGITAIGQNLAMLGGAAATPLVGMIAHFQEVGDAFEKMAIRTGITVETLSELGFAALQSGADLDTLEGGLRKMQKLLVDAAGGSAGARDTLRQLGLTITDLKALSPDEQFLRIADGLSKIENPTLRAALAMDLFGKNGAKLLPLLGEGADGIRELQEMARELGLTVSTEDAEAAAAFGDALDTLKATLKQVAFTIGSALAPILTELLDPVTRFVVVALKWVQQNQALVVTVAKVIVGVTALGVALMGIGTTISLAGAAIGGIATLITGTLVAVKAVAIGAFLAVKAIIVGTGVVLGALLSPIGLVVTAVVGLAAAFLYFTGLGAKALTWLGDTAGRALGWLGQQFTRLKQTALTAWGGIADSLAVGDIGLAAKILWLTLRMEWLRGIAWLTDRWLAFKNGMLTILDQAMGSLARIVNDGWAWVKGHFGESLDFLRQVWDAGLVVLGQAWDLFVEGVLVAWDWLQSAWSQGTTFLSENWGTFTEFLSSAWSTIEETWVSSVDFLSDSWTTFVAGLQKGWNQFAGVFEKGWARIQSVIDGTDAHVEIARIDQQITEENQSIDTQRDATIAGRKADRERRMQQAEADRVAAEEQLQRDQAADQAGRDAARNESRQSSVDRLAAARREWEAAIAEAKQQREQAAPPVPGRGNRVDVPELTEVVDTVRQKIDIQGTFNALAVRGLGADSLSERTTKATEQTAQNTKKILQEVQHGGLTWEE